MVLVNMRERWKIQHIERRLRKRLNHKQIPTGYEICKAKLACLATELKAASISESQMAPFLPSILGILDGLSRDELITRVFSLKLERFFKDYHGTPDINTGHGALTPAGPHQGKAGYRKPPLRKHTAPTPSPARRHMEPRGRTPDSHKPAHGAGTSVKQAPSHGALPASQNHSRNKSSMTSEQNAVAAPPEGSRGRAAKPRGAKGSMPAWARNKKGK